MRKSLLARYFFAGMLLNNSIPHFIIGLTGRRNMTPFARNSSAQVNILWGLINFGGAFLLVRSSDKKAAGYLKPHEWLQSMLAGGLFWSAFMMIMEATGYTHRDA